MSFFFGLGNFGAWQSFDVCYDNEFDRVDHAILIRFFFNLTSHMLTKTYKNFRDVIFFVLSQYGF